MHFKIPEFKMKKILGILFLLIISNVNCQYHKLKKANKYFAQGNYTRALLLTRKAASKKGRSLMTEYMELLIKSKTKNSLSDYEELKIEIVKLKSNYETTYDFNFKKACKKEILCEQYIENLLEFTDNKIFSIYNQSNSIDDLETYLELHQHKIYSEIIRGKIDSIIFSQYIYSNSLRTLNEYTELYHHEAYTKAINRKIDSLLLQEINNKPSSLNYKRFLDYRTNSYFEKEVKDNIEQYEFIEATTIEKLKEFIKNHKNSSYDSSVNKRLQKFEWEGVKEKNTVKTYEDFITENPNSPYKDSASQKITFLKNLVLPFLGADKKYRLINTFTNEYQSLETFDNIKYIASNFLRIEKSNLFGVIDLQGNIIIPTKYNSITSNQQSLFIVELNSKFGILNSKGKQLTPLLFENVETIDNRKLIVAQKNGKQYNYGLIDNFGNTILPVKYSYIDPLHQNGKSIVKVTDKYFLIDSTGNQIGKSYKGMYLIGEEILQTYNGINYGLMRLNGDVIFEPKWRSVLPSATDEFIIENNLKEKGIIDKNENQLWPFNKIQYIEYLSDNNYSINISTDPNVQMNIIYSTQLKKIISGIENYVNASIIDSKRYAIEKNNKDLEIYNKEWQLLKSFPNVGNNNYTRYQRWNQGACGGVEEYEPKSLYQINENDIISNINSELKEIYFGEKVGLINQNNEIVLPIEFDEIVQFKNGHINTVKYDENNYNYNYSKPHQLNIFFHTGKQYIKNQNIVGINKSQILTTKNYDSKYSIINRENKSIKNLNEEIKYIKFFNDFITYYINDALVFQLVNGFQLTNNSIDFYNEKNTYDEYRYSKEEINEEDFNSENKVKNTNIFYELDKDKLFSFLSNESEEKLQANESKEEEILEYIDEDAGFPGGPAAMQQWISRNVQYTQSAIELGEQGKVYVSFIVEPDGSISNVVVERGVSDDLDREAKRLVRSMPRWKPGKNNGKAVRARCRIPLSFNLR